MRHLILLLKTRAMLCSARIITGGFKISTVCSLQFVAVNGHNVKDLVSVHLLVWAINNVALYQYLTVITFNNSSSLQKLIYFDTTEVSGPNLPTVSSKYGIDNKI